MRKTEQKLWDRFRRNCGPHVRLERIENVVGVGMPDVLTCCRITAFVELKAVEAPPARATTRVLGDKGLSQDQKNWHKNWAQWGGTSFILIGVGARIFMLRGSLGDRVNDMTMEELQSAAAATDWLRVAQLLGGSFG